MKISAKHQTALKMKGDIVLTDPCYFFKGSKTFGSRSVKLCSQAETIVS